MNIMHSIRNAFIIIVVIIIQVPSRSATQYCSSPHSEYLDICNNGDKAVIRNDDEVRIVVVGKTGSGKSASGNTILGKDAFETKFSFASMTKKCKKVSNVVNGRKVTVVDTPGLFDTRFSTDETLKDIDRTIHFAAPGPHAFLIVIKLGRFTNEEKKCVKMIQKEFGEMSSKYTMILFTHGDLLENEPIESVINNSPDVQELIRTCEGRYHVFNNKADDPSQVTELLQKIHDMVLKNGGSHYTNEMLQEAERKKQEEIAELRRQVEEELEKIFGSKMEEFVKLLDKHMEMVMDMVDKMQNEQRERDAAKNSISDFLKAIAPIIVGLILNPPEQLSFQLADKASVSLQWAKKALIT